MVNWLFNSRGTGLYSTCPLRHQNTADGSVHAHHVYVISLSHTKHHTRMWSSATLACTLRARCGTRIQRMCRLQRAPPADISSNTKEHHRTHSTQHIAQHKSHTTHHTEHITGNRTQDTGHTTGHHRHTRTRTCSHLWLTGSLYLVNSFEVHFFMIRFYLVCFFSLLFIFVFCERHQTAPWCL